MWLVSLHPTPIPTTKVNHHMTSEQLVCISMRQCKISFSLFPPVYGMQLHIIFSFLRGGGSITPEFNFRGESRSECHLHPTRRYLHIHECTPVQ
jgi:hypothetical protein